MTPRHFRIAFAAAMTAAAALVTVAVASLVLLSIGASPWATFVTIFTGPLTSVFNAGEVGVRMVPLMLVALGVAISFRGGIINIGAEGQMLTGILATTAVALALPGLPPPLLLGLALAAGAGAGALWAGIAGWLRARLQVNEILSTVMLNYIAAQLYTFLLRGPMIDPDELMTGSGTPQSMRLPRSAWLDRIVPGTRLHTGLLLALVLAALVWALLWRTTLGYRLRAAGAGPKAARYAGIRVEQSLLVAMLFAGAFAGLAGGVEVVGVHHRAVEAISAGYGFAGIVVALFGGLHPAGIVPAAAFFGVMLVGTQMTQHQAARVPGNMVLVLEGLVILAIVSSRMVIQSPYAQDRAARLLRRLVRPRSASDLGARPSTPGPEGPTLRANGNAEEAEP